MKEIVATGWWCKVCEFVEQEQDLDGTRCMSCGCDEADHAPCEVITEES